MANAVGLVVLAVPLPGRMRSTQHLAVLPAVVAAVQMIGEGYRWQLVPAYLLSVGIALWWAARVSRSKQPAVWGRILGAGVGSVVLMVSVVVPVAVPVFSLPKPMGPYAIGTVTYHWRDDDRREIFDGDPATRREVMAQVWYPAEPGTETTPAPYVSDATTLAPAAGRLLGLPGFVFSHLGIVPTHTTERPPLASDRPRYPVLVFTSGLNGFRQSNMFQVEQLVSQGFVVVGLDQPYTSAVTVFPDGRSVYGWPKNRLVDVIQQSITPVTPPPLLGDVPMPDGLFPYLAQDISLALDRLGGLNNADPHGLFTGRLDLDRAGAFGISLGAITTGQACHRDPRLRACLMMDAAMPADVVRDGLRQPSMWLTRDADSILLERDRSGGWPDHEIEETLTTQRATFDKSPPGRGYLVEIPGMFHLNFTDAPGYTPLAQALAMSGPIGAERGHDIVAGYSVAFFNRFLGDSPGDGVALLDGPPPWPTVHIDRH
ncbi:alpha/beta hydrolase family protein [Mycolicibacterium thermoresistibile]